MFNGFNTGFEPTNSEMINTKGDCEPNLFPRYPFEVVAASGLYVDDKIVICSGFFVDSLSSMLTFKTSKDCYQLKKGAESFEYNPGMNKKYR